MDGDAAVVQQHPCAAPVALPVQRFFTCLLGQYLFHVVDQRVYLGVAGAGGDDKIVRQRCDFRNFQQPQEKSIIITNPPYGERITTDDILGLYEDIGSTLKHSFVGGDAWILSYHEECFARLGFRPSTKFALYNGPLPCEFRKYQVFEGRLRERRQEGMDIKTSEERERNKSFKGNKALKSRENKEATQELSRHNFKWGDRRKKEDLGE